MDYDFFQQGSFIQVHPHRWTCFMNEKQLQNVAKSKLLTWMDIYNALKPII